MTATLARYPGTVKGQLDCIEHWRKTTHFDQHDETRQSKAAGTKSDPAFPQMLAVMASAQGSRPTISFPMLKKNPAKYASKPWYIERGKILEIHEQDGVTIARIRAGTGLDDAVYVVGRFETDFVEGQSVDAIGLLAGEITYTARIGELTIPAMAAAAFFKAGGVEAVSNELEREERERTRRARGAR